MKCPYCLQNFTEEWSSDNLERDAEGNWTVYYCVCPNLECRKIIVDLENHKMGRIRVKPKVSNRNPIPSQVPPNFSEDYVEACLVLSDSPKASAALSRRCLQNLLREKSGINPGDLVDEIQDVIDSKQLPTSLSDQLDAVRVIGNFSTHPIKSKSTGEIIEVEPGEAEWNLDVLEELFDFYFVREERIKARKDSINQKLKEAGKPEIK